MNDAPSAALTPEQLIGKIDFADSATWPNERVGRYLLSARLLSLANEICPTAPMSLAREQFELWRLRLAEEETDDVSLVPLEKAQRLAARGEFERAGNLFRQFMLDGAVRLHDERDGAAARERLTKCREGGAKGGSKPKAGKLPSDICDQYLTLIESGRSVRDARSVLRQKYGVSGPGLTKALKKAGL